MRFDNYALSSCVNDRPTKVSQILKTGGLRWKEPFFYNRRHRGVRQVPESSTKLGSVCARNDSAAHPTLDDAVSDGALVTSQRSPLEVAPSADLVGSEATYSRVRGLKHSVVQRNSQRLRSNS